MTSVTSDNDILDIGNNPIDSIEEYVAAHDWAFSRFDQDELFVEMSGKCGIYRMHFLWRSELGALYFSCAMEKKVPENKKPEMYELLARVNESLWLGHFDLPQEEGVPMFRHTCLMRGAPAGAEQLEDLVEIAIMECDRFYPAFELALSEHSQSPEAMMLAMLDVAGEA